MMAILSKHHNESHTAKKIFWVLVAVSMLLMLFAMFPPKAHPVLGFSLDKIRPALEAYAGGKTIISSGSIRAGSDFYSAENLQNLEIK